MAADDAKGRSPAELLAESKRARSAWCELDEPKRRAVQLRRPLDVEMLAWSGKRLGAVDLVGIVCSSAVDWRGFTSADVLGPDVGSDDEAPFSPDLFAEWAGDHTDEASRLAGEVMQRVEAHTAKRKAEAKNSATS